MIEPSLFSQPVQVNYGDLWQLGPHRLLCGDSTQPESVSRLFGDEKAVLVVADPPYGMGKEKDGVANDNLYGEKLDAFQMAWWKAGRPYLTDNASAYIWGNAEDLWRLWYAGGLKDSERLTLRNEIVWAKGDAGAGGISHQGMEGLRLYPQETERCLFFMLGEQEMSTNADNYWEGWEPIRSYLDTERKQMGWSDGRVRQWLGMNGHDTHLFSISQWRFLSPEQYAILQEKAQGQAFKRDYDILKRDFLALRAYFDNTHENMTDVWNFSRVQGNGRCGHPTPKPVKMMKRILKSSSPPDSLIYDPFMGSGSTLIAAQLLNNRRVYGCEISPAYCEMIIHRWQDTTAQQAQLVEVE